MLELDEMKQKWAEHDRKLEETIRLNRQLLSATNLNGARSALQRLTLFVGVEAIVWLAIVVALGKFIYEHASVLKFALAGAASDVFAIGMFAAAVAQIGSIRQIDYAQPVAAIQRQMERLRVLRIRTVQRGLLAGTVVWAPFLIVVSNAFWGVTDFSAAWLWANVAFGLALIPLAIWASTKFADRMGAAAFVQQLMRDIAGRNLNAAATFLATISQFEAE
jgi:hypothetical protein